MLPPAGFGVVVLWSSVGGSGGERCGEESGAGEVGGRRGNVATRTTWRGAEGARELMAAGPPVRLALAFQSCTTRWTTWTGRIELLTSPFAVSLSNHINRRLHTSTNIKNVHKY